MSLGAGKVTSVTAAGFPAADPLISGAPAGATEEAPASIITLEAIGLFKYHRTDWPEPPRSILLVFTRAKSL